MGEINLKIKEDKNAPAIENNKNSINSISMFKKILEDNKGLIDINVNTLLKKNTILERRKTVADTLKIKDSAVSEDEISK